MSKMSHKNTSAMVSFTVGMMLSILGLYWVFHDFDFSTVILTLNDVNYLYVSLAAVLMVFTIFLRAIRWQYLLEEGKLIAVNTLFASEFIGYFGNFVLPFRLGELLRTYVLSGEEEMPKSTIFGSIVMERILDTMGIVFISVVLILIYPLPDDLKRYIEWSFLGVLVLGVLIFMVIRYLRFTEFNGRVTLFMKRFFSSFSVLSGKHRWNTIVISLFMWFIYWLCTYLIQASMDLRMHMHESLLVLILTTLAASIPSAPGSIGTFHAAVKYVLVTLIGGYTINQAANFAILLHAYGYILLSVIGAYYFFTSQFRKGAILTVLKKRNLPE